MKSIRFIFYGLFILLASCGSNDIREATDIEKLIKTNKEKITISTGLSGTLLKQEGDLMPSSPPLNRSKQYPISRTILIYEYSTIKDITGYGPFFDTVNSKLIDQCTSDNDGFFQLTLSPGKYSMFIKENGKFYMDGVDGQGGISPFTIKTDSVSNVIMILDYATY